MFGNSNAKVQADYNLNFDGTQIGKGQVAAEKESLAVSNWTKVGGKR